MILTVAGAKGGTAKTTTALALAAELGKLRRVAVRDLDPQGSGTLALNHEPVADPWLESPVEVANFHLYRGGRTVGLAGDLRHQLTTAAHDCAILILDVGPTLDALALAALEAATLALVPLRPSGMDLVGFRDVAAIVRALEPPRPLLRAVLTQVHQRRRLSGDVVEYMHQNAPGSLYSAMVPDGVAGAEAGGYGLPVTVYAPRSPVAEAYRALAAEVMRDLGRGRRRS